MTTTLRRPTLLISAAAVAMAVIVIAAWAKAGDTVMSIPEALLLGIVEGLTEFLPVSSTGHLEVTLQLLGLNDTKAMKDASDAYAIAIQAGAIVAVLGIYRRRIADAILAIAGRGHDPVGGRRLAIALVVAFIPSAVVGLALEKSIKAHLFGLWPIIGAWLVGGVVILVWPETANRAGRALETIGWRDALIIGLAQCLALWPGTSRSLVVILAALAVGLSIAASVEFAFLLGLLTLGAATLHEAVSKGHLIVDRFGWTAPIVGFVAAFVSAAAAVLWMITYVQRHGMRVFGWYRIAVACIVAVLALTVLS